MTWDGDRHVARLEAAAAGGPLTRVFGGCLIAFLVGLAVILGIGSAVLEGGYDWRTLAPLGGVPIVIVILRANRTADAQRWVEIGPSGLTWQDGQPDHHGRVSWDEVDRLRRTRRYTFVAATGDTTSMLTHGMVAEADDGRVWRLPDMARAGLYGRLVDVAVDQQVVPGGIEFVGLRPDDTPSSTVPPRDRELPPGVL